MFLLPIHLFNFLYLCELMDIYFKDYNPLLYLFIYIALCALYFAIGNLFPVHSYCSFQYFPSFYEHFHALYQHIMLQAYFVISLSSPGINHSSKTYSFLKNNIQKSKSKTVGFIMAAMMSRLIMYFYRLPLCHILQLRGKPSSVLLEINKLHFHCSAYIL